MKSLLPICLVYFLLAACSNSGSDFIVGEETVSIVSVDAPDTLTIGSKSTFAVEFKVPSTCHQFLRLNFGLDGKQRTISVVMSINDGNCNPLSNATQSIAFEVTPDEPGLFTFKFFTGNDSQGNPTFIVKEYEVTMEPAG